MRIKHIQKTSLIDYPGHIASIIFIGGCNFDCNYCYNHDLKVVDTLPDIPVNEIHQILAKQKKFIEGLVITGGEPTLEGAELIHFCEQVKTLHGLKIKLDTNGSNPQILADLIEQNLIDYIAMDIKAPISKYNQISGTNPTAENLLKSIDLIQNFSGDKEFRTTIWKEFFSASDIQEIIQLIQGSKNYYLQNFFNPLQQKQPGYTPFSKKEIEPFLQEARQLIQNVELRGSWI